MLSTICETASNEVILHTLYIQKNILGHADYSTFHSHCAYCRSCDSSRSPFVGTPILTSMSPTCSMVCLTAAWKRASSNVQVRDRKVAVSRWASHGMQKMLDHMHPTTTWSAVRIRINYIYIYMYVAQGKRPVVCCLGPTYKKLPCVIKGASNAH